MEMDADRSSAVEPRGQGKGLAESAVLAGAGNQNPFSRNCLMQLLRKAEAVELWGKGHRLSSRASSPAAQAKPVAPPCAISFRVRIASVLEWVAQVMEFLHWQASPQLACLKSLPLSGGDRRRLSLSRSVAGEAR